MIRRVLSSAPAAERQSLSLSRATAVSFLKSDQAVTDEHGPYIFTLPMPPSVNKMFRNVRGRGRVKTNIYVDWTGHAGWVLKRQWHSEPLTTRCLAVVSVERSSLAADVDNRVKAIFDLLVSGRVIRDDSLITAFAAAWAPPGSRLARIQLIPIVVGTPTTITFHAASSGSTGGWFVSDPQSLEEQF